MPLGVGHFLRCADLVGVEVVEPGFSLWQPGISIDSGQWCVTVWLVDVGAVALGLLFLKQAQALPEKGCVLGLAALRDLFSNAAPEGVVVVTRFAVQGCAVPGLGMDQAAFAIVGEALHCAVGAALFAEVAPVVVGKTQVFEGDQTVVLDAIELPTAAAAKIAGRVVGKVFGVQLRVVRLAAA